MSDKQGPEECPQLLSQEGEILIPVGVSKSITVIGKNLPDEDRVCIMKLVNIWCNVQFIDRQFIPIFCTSATGLPTFVLIGRYHETVICYANCDMVLKMFFTAESFCTRSVIGSINDRIIILTNWQAWHKWQDCITAKMLYIYRIFAQLTVTVSYFSKMNNQKSMDSILSYSSRKNWCIWW